MKKLLLAVATVIGLAIFPARGQMGPHGGGQGPQFGGAIGKLFGDNQSFSAQLEFQTKMGNDNNVVMPGKIAFDNGKSRFEMNMSEMRGTGMQAGTGQQMKAMGLDTMVAISRPDLKVGYAVYPGLNSYAEMTSTENANREKPEDFKAETVELGKETLDGHECVKNKVTVTDKDGNKHESTVWNATDLKNFPIKIETEEGSKPVTMLFKNVTFEKPAASVFEAPSGFTKYDNVQTMMQTEMMKKMGGGLGAPPH